RPARLECQAARPARTAGGRPRRPPLGGHTRPGGYLGPGGGLPAPRLPPHPAAGFVGRINDRTDLSLLEAIADRGRSLLLVGPKDPAFEPERFDALRRRRNVRSGGPKPFEALSRYFRAL